MGGCCGSPSTKNVEKPEKVATTTPTPSNPVQQQNLRPLEEPKSLKKDHWDQPQKPETNQT